MNANGCPSPAELARFLDGNLSASEARRLRVHVAGCESCQEVVSEAMVFLEGEAGGESEEPMEAEESVEANLQPHPFPVGGEARPAVGKGAGAGDGSAGGGLPSPARWLPLAAAVLLALGLAAAWWLTSRPMGDVAALAAAQGEHRPTLVRLSDFPHAPPTPVQRSGSGGDGADYALLAEAARLQAQAEEDPTAANLHSLGLAHLMLGRYDEAIFELERAAESTDAPDLERRIRTALAAALLEQGIETGQARTVARAHELLAELVEARPDPDLLFNTALALGELGARRSAIETWDRYLESDPDSPWAEEARRRRARLVEMEEAEPEESAEAVERRVLHELLPTEGPVSREQLTQARALADRYRRMHRDSWLLDVVSDLESGVGSSVVGTHFSAYIRIREARQMGRVERCLAASADDKEPRAVQRPMHLDQSLARASCAFLANELSEAGWLGRQVEASASALGYPVLAGQGAWLAGLSAHGQRRLGASLLYYEKALQWFGEARDTQRQAAILGRLSDLYHSLGRMEEAWEEAVRAVDEPGQSASRRHQALNFAADLAQGEGWLQLRRSYLEEASRLGPEVSADHHANVLRKLASVEGTTGTPEASRAAFRRAEAEVAKIPDRLNRQRAQARLDADLAAFLAEREPRAARLRLRSAEPFQDSMAELVYELALTRSRVALAEGDAQAAERSFQDALGRSQGDLAELHRLEDRAALHHARRRLVETYVSYLVDRDRDLEAWHVVTSSRQQVIQTSGAPVVAVSPPYQGVPTMTLFSLPEKLLVWHTGNGRFELRQVTIARQELKRLVEEVGRWVEGAGPFPGSESASILSRLLLEGADWGDGPLAVTPDEITAPLPFGALPAPRSGQPLFVSTPVVTSPAGIRSPVQTVRGAGAGCALLIQGATSGGDSYPELRRLTLVREELSAIRSLYPCHRWARTRGEIAAALGQGVEIIHYAGHGDGGVSGGLFLEEEGEVVRVSPEEIQAWPLAGTQVVLSACSTSRIRPGYSGLSSIAHSFLAAGARAVVSHRTGIVDVQAPEIAVALHTGLKQSVSLPRALQRVQQDYFARALNVQLWAGWSVFTMNPQPPEKEQA